MYYVLLEALLKLLLVASLLLEVVSQQHAYNTTSCTVRSVDVDVMDGGWEEAPRH